MPGVDEHDAGRRRAALEPRRRDARRPLDRRRSPRSTTASTPREIPNAELVPFTAQTRMSGVDFDGQSIRKGAADSVRRWVVEQGGDVPDELETIVDGIATQGGTPLVVADGTQVLGVIYLKDIVKQGMTERFDELRAMGIRTVMITGDNPRTAAAIAAEAGVDDFLAEATPEDKMALIKREQLGGSMVAMTGDGTNDAPALAQADVGVAMNTGTQAAKEAGNMVDLDSNPTKLIEIVEIGKQLLITRGSLTTFSIANDVAKYFAIIPAMFVGVFPALETLNIMKLDNPHIAILSAVIFNALIIVALIPLALRGREVPGARRGGGAAAQPLDLRRRRDHRPVHRDQAHRPRRHRAGSALMMRRQLLTGLLMTDRADRARRARVPARRDRDRAGALTSDRANGSFVTSERQGRRLVADRAELHRQNGNPIPRTSSPARRTPATATTRWRAAGPTSGRRIPNLIGNVPGVVIDLDQAADANPYANRRPTRTACRCRRPTRTTTPSPTLPANRSTRRTGTAPTFATRTRFPSGCSRTASSTVSRANVEGAGRRGHGVGVRPRSPTSPSPTPGCRPRGWRGPVSFRVSPGQPDRGRTHRGAAIGRAGEQTVNVLELNLALDRL